jgi:hypothetical protein
MNFLLLCLLAADITIKVEITITTRPTPPTAPMVRQLAVTPPDARSALPRAVPMPPMPPPVVLRGMLVIPPALRPLPIAVRSYPEHLDNLPDHAMKRRSE